MSNHEKSNHDMISAAMAPHRGNVLTTKEIRKYVLDAFVRVSASDPPPALSPEDRKLEDKTDFQDVNCKHMECLPSPIPRRKGGNILSGSVKRAAMLTINELWRSSDPAPWETALERYWQFVQERNRALELKLDCLELERVRGLDALGWYDFLRLEYFRWKYTAPNRYATTTKRLAEYVTAPGGLEQLHNIKRRLLAIDPTDNPAGLTIAWEIKGLGAAGASGLLALLYPTTFATVDQFVVKALRQVDGLPEADALAKMKPESLTTADGVMLIAIMARKAAQNNRLFGTDSWTPRKIDKILWTYGR
jgi:hypothetical protein